MVEKESSRRGAEIAEKNSFGIQKLRESPLYLRCFQCLLPSLTLLLRLKETSCAFFDNTNGSLRVLRASA